MRAKCAVRLAIVVVAVGLVSACSSSAATQETSAVAAEDRAALEAIARLEDRRTLGPEGQLLNFLGQSDPGVRARAATALGRLKFPVGGEAATAELREALRDANESVRAAAAFALGMREDPAAYEELVELGAGAKKDASPLVRARALEAASKLGRMELTELFLSGLEDGSPEVRLEAAAGAARWKTDEPRASEVNARLAAFVAQEADRRVRTYGLFALERRKAVEGREVFFECAKASDVEERLFAVRGLAAIKPTPEVEEALIAASRDGDWRVAVEASRGLAKYNSRPALEAIAAGIGHGSHHVRAVALETATEQFDAFQSSGLGWRTQGVGNFERIWDDPSMAVRCAAMRYVLRFDTEVLVEQDKWPHLSAAYMRELARNDRWVELGGYLMFSHHGVEWSLLERGARVEAMAGAMDGTMQSWFLGSLSDPDNGVRLAAVTEMLAKNERRLDMLSLESCYETATGEISPELRFNLLKLAAKIGGEDAIALLERGLQDEDAYVRRVAHDELEKLTGKSIPWTDRALPEVEIAFPGVGLLADPRPHVVLSTSRGEMEFVLFADEAPQHVRNFLEHMDFYAGTTFHRVVSDFVAQGGDQRGDGNGGSSWRGDSLRHEISARKYVRGSLGMPRNEDWDSGGSQIFVTHRPTPHLDGRYTIFGELVKGFEVLDALDLGDRIVAARRVR